VVDARHAAPIMGIDTQYIIDGTTTHSRGSIASSNLYANGGHIASAGRNLIAVIDMAWHRCFDRIKKRRDFMRLPGDLASHGPVGFVANPAANSESLGGLRSHPSKSNPLHPPPKHDGAADVAHSSEAMTSSEISALL